MFLSGCGDVNHPPLPYVIDSSDGDVVINDDGRTHPAKVSRKRTCIGLPSKLFQTENIDNLMAVNEHLKSAAIENSHTIPPNAFATSITETERIVSVDTSSLIQEAVILKESDREEVESPLSTKTPLPNQQISDRLLALFSDINERDDVFLYTGQSLRGEDDNTLLFAMSECENTTIPSIGPQDGLDLMEIILDLLLSSDESLTDSDHDRFSSSFSDTSSTGSSVPGDMRESDRIKNLSLHSVPNFASFSQPPGPYINKGFDATDAVQLDDTITQAVLNTVRIPNERHATLTQPVAHLHESVIDQPLGGTIDDKDGDEDFDYQSDDELELRDGDSEDSWLSHIEIEEDVRVRMHRSFRDSLINQDQITTIIPFVRDSAEVTPRPDKSSSPR